MRIWERISVSGTKYVNIEASESGIERKNGNLIFRAALVNLKEYNHVRNFAARSYVCYKADGREYIHYSEFSEQNNVRNIADIAVRALKDVLPNADGEYTEPFQGGYSCYGNLQRDILMEYTTKIDLAQYFDNCSVIYNSNDGFSANIASRLKTAIYNCYGKNVILRDINADQTVSEHEILIGNTGRKESTDLLNAIYADELFLLEVINGKIVLSVNPVAYPSESDQSKNTTHKYVNLFWGAVYLEKLFQSFSTIDEFCFYRADENLSEIKSLRGNENNVKAYQAIYGTYNSYLDVRLQGADSGFSAAAISDQETVQRLIESMGDSSAVFYVGSSNVLHQGFIRKADPDDYTKSVKTQSSKLLVPQAFISRHFSDLSIDGYVDADGFVNLSNAVSVSSEYTLIKAATFSSMYILRKNGSFSDYSDYISRMEEFFKDKYQTGAIDTEQSRVEIESIGDFPEYVADWEIEEHDTTYSPSVATVSENGKKVIYVAYEYANVTGGWTQNTCLVKIKKSIDDGKTWQDVGTVKDLQWASMFALNNEIYLIGNQFIGNAREGGAMIAKVESDGTVRSALISSVSEIGGGGPGTVLIHEAGGVKTVFKAYNKKTVYARADSDLLDPSSWNASDKLSNVVTLDWVRSASGNSSQSSFSVCEGNLTVMDGIIYNIMRIDNLKHSTLEKGYAVLVKLVSDGNGGYKYQDPQLIEFPTTWTKFAVRYDEQTDTYITLSNIKTHKNAINRQRSVLCLATSKDLVNWTIQEYVLVDREMMNSVCSAAAHGFQYADFVIDGDNIIMAVREASGNTALYHDGNYTTFYRIDNFRTLI